MVLFIQNVVLTFVSVDEVQWRDYSDKTSSAVVVLFIYYVVLSNF